MATQLIDFNSLVKVTHFENSYFGAGGGGRVAVEMAVVLAEYYFQITLKMIDIEACHPILFLNVLQT